MPPGAPLKNWVPALWAKSPCHRTIPTISGELVICAVINGPFDSHGFQQHCEMPMRKRTYLLKMLACVILLNGCSEEKMYVREVMTKDKAGDLDGALSAANKAVELEPNNARAY